MSYRKIVVDETEYQYSVGKSNVHIKGGKLTKPLNFLKDDVGEKYEWRCDCCGERMSSLGYRAEEIGYNTAVTPRVIRYLILKHAGYNFGRKEI